MQKITRELGVETVLGVKTVLGAGILLESETLLVKLLNYFY